MDLQKLIVLTKSEFTSLIFIFIIAATLVFGTRLGRLSSGEAIVFEQDSELIFENRGSLDDLVGKLDTMNVKFNEAELRWAASLLGWRSFQRGRYEVSGANTYQAFLSKMTLGIQDPVSIVILPGIDQERLAAAAAEKLNFDAEMLIRQFRDSSYLETYELTEQEMFGRMLPETYLMYWTVSPSEFIDKVLNEFSRSFTPEMEAKAKEMGHTIDEIVTLASIVEWEAKYSSEKARISGLYWNRLKRGMRLQADPTVIYALGERRRLLFEDYQLDHPYNTYMKRGLPPGPITNPSLETIKATLNPEDHNYLYMVANPEGGHVFTRTFEEHQVESEKWRIWLRKQYRIKRLREAEENQASSE